MTKQSEIGPWSVAASIGPGAFTYACMTGHRGKKLLSGEVVLRAPMDALHRPTSTCELMSL